MPLNGWQPVLKTGVQITVKRNIPLERSYLVLAQLEQAIQVKQQIGRGKVGRLMLGFVGSATYTVLPDILGVFREQFPAVELGLQELTTQQQIQALHHKQTVTTTSSNDGFGLPESLGVDKMQMHFHWMELLEVKVPLLF